MSASSFLLSGKMHLYNMVRPESYPIPPSFLTTLHKERRQLPSTVRASLDAIKSQIKDALHSEDPFNLEAALQPLIPQIWSLRLETIALFPLSDLRKSLEIIEPNFSSYLDSAPKMHPIIVKLAFGLHLMVNFIQDFIKNQPDLPVSPAVKPTAAGVMNYQQFIRTLEENETAGGSTLSVLIKNGLMIELLVFTVDLIVQEAIPIECGMYQELDYQAAVAVKAYAAVLGVPETALPWYQAAQNDFQKLLLDGPVVQEADLQYVQEKRKHLNSWK